MAKLTELAVGETGLITQVNCEALLLRRLTELGVRPGVFVTQGPAAPFGDPVSFFILNYHLGLRRSQADEIIIERVHTDGNSTKRIDSRSCRKSKLRKNYTF